MKKAIIIVFIFFFSFLFFIPKSQAQTSPSCSSLAVGNRTNIVSGTTANVTPGQSVDLVANIANDNGNRNNSSWGASGGTYSSKNWDYATWVAPSTPGNYSITYALSGVNQTNCSVVFRVPAPTPTCTGIKTSTNASLINLSPNNSYTFVGNNCLNVSTYRWVFERGNCPFASVTSTTSNPTIPITIPILPISTSSCSFKIGLQVCNAANQCAQYSQNPIVKNVPPTSAPTLTPTPSIPANPTATPRPSPCNGIGDVNNDGFVTEADALLVLRHLAGFENFTADQLRRANVNGGAIDTSDALSIRRFIAGLDTTFLACPTPTSSLPALCDPDPNGSSAGKLDNQDLAVIRNELLGLVSTNRGACLNNAPDNASTSTTGNTALARIRNILLGLENAPQ